MKQGCDLRPRDHRARQIQEARGQLVQGPIGEQDPTEAQREQCWRVAAGNKAGGEPQQAHDHPAAWHQGQQPHRGSVHHP